MITLENIQSIWQSLTNADIIAKFFLIIISLLFMLFTIIVARQVYILNNIVKQVSFSPIFESLAMLLVIMSIILFIFVLFI